MSRHRLAAYGFTITFVSLVWLILSANFIWAQAEDPASKIFLAPDDHTDYFWTADDVTYRQAFLEMLDYYLDQIDQTQNAPPEFQARWNCDGSLWLWEYERHKSRREFERLIERIRDGHISAPLTTLVSTYGAQPAEAVLRGMYYSGTLERRFDLRFPLAVSMENQTLPLGLGSLWSGAGAKYSWRGVCACASKMPQSDLAHRDHEVYWWTGLDGSRVLMKWYSLYGNASLGGYAEARRPREAIDLVRQHPQFRRRHAFTTIGIFGQGWDDLKTLSDEFPKVAREKSLPDQPVVVSNEEDFFGEFERRHGADLAAESVSYGNEWDLLCASMAEQTSRVRRAVEKLRTAEALATVVSQRHPEFWTSRTEDRELAHLNLGLYWEHDWTSDAGEPMRSKRAAWQRQLADQISGYVDELHDAALVELAQRISNRGDTPRFVVFNPCGWRRGGVVDLPFTEQGDWHVIDVATGGECMSQDVAMDGHRLLRVFMPDTPPIGYHVVELRRGPGAHHTEATQPTGNSLENSRLRVVFNETGAITNLTDRASGRERIAAQGCNILSGTGPSTPQNTEIRLESNGPVSSTFRIMSETPLPHTTRITLRHDADWVEIENTIEANFDDVRTWDFGFNLTDPDVHHEEVGAILRARLVDDGGHYAKRNARCDWLSLGHFVNMQGTDGGVTLANADCAFFRLGESSANKLDTTTSRIAVLAGGQLDSPNLGIPRQDGDRWFRQRFALRPHGDEYDATGAMRWSVEWQNPLVARRLNAASDVPAAAGSLPASELSLLSLQEPAASPTGAGVLVWAVKPSEEGIQSGLIVRAWNVSDQRRTARLKLAGLRSAHAASHIETNLEPLAVTDQQTTLDFRPQQIRTVRLAL